MTRRTDTPNHRSLTAAVEQLLKEGKAQAIERECSTYDRISGSGNKPVVLFGAGNLGRKTLAGLRKVGVEPLAFTDSSPGLWNTTVDNLGVLPPAEAARLFGMTAVFVISIWTGEGYDRMAQREKQLRDLGCLNVSTFVPLFWKFADTFLPHYAVDLPQKVHDQSDQVLRACELWNDDESRREYLAQVRWRLLGDFDDLPDPVSHSTYFPPDLCGIKEGEVFVDCGAFDGDTIEVFLEQPNAGSGQIYAFEADPANFSRLERAVRALPGIGSIKVHKAAVGAFNGTTSFCASGNEASYVSSGGVGIPVESVTLDGILGDVEPTYIKMDIEGAELDALTGAAKIIERNSPVLSVCTYHRQDHLWKIPLLIRSINPSYRFFLRPHLLEVWDLVCYAIPPNRLRQ